MVNNIEYVSIQEIASRLTRHPLMAEITIEPIVQYTIDFMHYVGTPIIFEDDFDTVKIRNYRGALPCNLLSVTQIRNKKTGISMRSTTDSFSGHPHNKHSNKGEDTFKTKGRVIFTSFEEGEVEIAFKSIKVDEHGFPLIPDDGVFLRTLELYIKKEYFTILHDLSKISFQALTNAQQEYAFAVGNLTSRYKMPSVSEMQSITGMMNQLFTRTNEFRKGFKNLGDKEYIKQQ